jgi:hypothetical protein
MGLQFKVTGAGASWKKQLTAGNVLGRRDII